MNQYHAGMTQTLQARKLKIAVLGCGRMGQRHAYNLARTARAELVAIADPSPAAAKWVASYLPGVQYYTSPEEAFEHPGLEAVIISTATDTHAPLALAAMAKGLHVLLEKPISVDVEASRPVVEAAEVAEQKGVKVMIGFVRRFDKAFQELQRHIATAAQKDGAPYILKSTTQDAYDSTGFFVQYAKASGGIFMDCGIHDIDMARWLLNTTSAGRGEVKRVLASGLLAAHPELAEQDDCDNALAIIEFRNGTSATLHLSRTGMSGYESLVEVYGLAQKCTVGTPAGSAVQIADAEGRRVTGPPTYMDRFGDAFVREAEAFVDCVLDDTAVPTSARDALVAAQIAKGLTASFRLGRAVAFDEAGEPVV